jgi:hypothetical protein
MSLENMEVVRNYLKRSRTKAWTRGGLLAPGHQPAGHAAFTSLREPSHGI